MERDMPTTATFKSPWSGDTAATMVPMPSDKTRFWWKSADGCVVGGQARAMSAARCVSFARGHAQFSNVKEA